MIDYVELLFGFWLIVLVVFNVLFVFGCFGLMIWIYCCVWSRCRSSLRWVLCLVVHFLVFVLLIVWFCLVMLIYVTCFV